MAPLLVAKLLILLLIANGTPIVAKKILGSRFAYPIDGNGKFLDGRPMFGQSKTIRGLALAILTTTSGAILLGFDWRIGALIGGFAMIGDLFSSFVKRRLDMPVSSQAPGVDQIPEALFPLLACRDLLSLTIVDMAAGVAIFVIGEVILSRLLYAIHVRDRPY